MTRRDVLALIRAMRREADAKPVVHIERTSAGSVTFGVRVAGRSLRAARELAQTEYSKLAAFAATMKDG